jgi:hypothetical protein
LMRIASASAERVIAVWTIERRVLQSIEKALGTIGVAEGGAFSDLP